MVTDFYRAMHMHNVGYAVAKCPSVGPSVTRRYVSKRLYISSKFFHSRVAPGF